MKLAIVSILLLLVVVGEAFADPRAFTFSIVARDPVTGEMGVAVQSHWFSVGSVVPWAEAGVGAVATQSIADTSYGFLGLDLMRSGRSPSDSLKALTSIDPQADLRQVAMIDATGRVAAFTGKRAIAFAGHHTGPNYSVQANLMRNDRVPDAMSKAFEKTRGDLADRLMAALAAAQSVGGDIRGRQSAALIVVSGKADGKPHGGRIFDLRVEDHAEPIVELQRLVRLQRAYNFMNRGDELAGQEKWDEAMKEYLQGAELAPEIDELRFWVAVTLFAAGREEEALPIFRETFRKNRDWLEVTRRLPASGLLPADKVRLERIYKQAEN